MRISVVIPTYNRVHLLRRTLPAILDQEFPAEDFEVFVVVDSSTDGTLEYLQSLYSPRLRTLVHDRNRGLAAARQTGLTAANGELVLFLDDDMVAERRLVAEHVAAHRDDTATVACGAVFLHPDSPDSAAADCFNAELGAFYLEHKKHPALAWDGTWVFMNSSAPRLILIQAGGFDERFREQREDLDLGLRLEALGVGQRFVPTAVGHQLYEKTAGDVVLDARHFAKGDLLLVQKHPEYRQRSAIARLVRGPLWRRGLRQIVMRSPISPDLLLFVPFWLAERCHAIPIFRRVALRLLRLRKAVAWARAVLDQTPGRSWKTLVTQFR
jgi:GT2 family glycosyltransferase